MDEIFKPIIIDGFVTAYEISNKGRVYSKKNRIILKDLESNCGYYRVRLYWNNKSAYKSIHRLVAIAFIPNPNGLAVVNHIDGNKHNNHVDNLEWCDVSYNMRHAYDNNLVSLKYGDESHLAKYKRKQVVHACELMESGEFTPKEISLLTDIDINMIYMIKNRLSWINVSKEYDVENCKQPKNDYCFAQLESAFKLLSENNLCYYDIMDITGVKTSTLMKIVSHDFTKFKFLYDKYNVDNYSSRKKIVPLPDNIQNDIMLYIDSGTPTTKIVEEISKQYNVNADKTRRFINRINHDRNVQRLSKGLK